MKNKAASWLDKLRVLPQYFIPQHFISSLVYRITRCETPWFKNVLIKLFISVFDVDMSLANNPDPESYSSFNTFFTRELSAEVRPISLDEKTILSPVDGAISQVGGIDNDTIIQAKGKSYTLKDLLVEDDLVTMFTGGTFATLYLSPKDYHRIHMPVSGQLNRMIYVPGKLFAVNSHTVRVVDSVFARNERVINIFNTDIGPMAMVLVGALNVGSMETVWAGQITPAKDRVIDDKQYSEGDVQLQQGQEMGRFNMGSTVILLFPKDVMQWSDEIVAEKTIIVGEGIGSVID
ncbi:MAG: phosphatidylserine decarboxylase [Gammaproteobacteria bacterium]|nr:MAG: phosphatidylserine decarboxylase [Gammaproteobacteria bacterium]